jgi:hypothetical protein
LWYGNGAAAREFVGRTTTSGSSTLFPQSNPANDITAGPDGALWFGSNGIGRMTTKGSVTYYGSNQPLDSHVFAVTTGPDGTVWFSDGNSLGQVTTAKDVVTSPTEGSPVTALTITGGGFSAGETVNVKYQTGLVSSATVGLCQAIAAGDGTFSCVATVPSTAGPVGTHTIKAIGQTSGVKALTTFLLTT